jgi:hypothetical protein
MGVRRPSPPPGDPRYKGPPQHRPSPPPPPPGRHFSAAPDPDLSHLDMVVAMNGVDPIGDPLETVQQLIREMAGLQLLQRVTVFQILGDYFCRRCGVEQPPGDCHCGDAPIVDLIRARLLERFQSDREREAAVPFFHSVISALADVHVLSREKVFPLAPLVAPPLVHFVSMQYVNGRPVAGSFVCPDFGGSRATSVPEDVTCPACIAKIPRDQW